MTGTTDDFLGAYQAPRITVRLTQRADLLARHAELHRAHQRAIRDDMAENRPPEAPGLLDDIRDIEQEIADSEFEFTFQSIGRHKYIRLLTGHPPRKIDRDDGLHFNGDTFPPALIAASAVEPEITEEQAVQIVDTISDGQFTKMWNAALTVNVGSDDAPKSVLRSATGELNGTSSNTADLGESPSQSSLDV